MSKETKIEMVSLFTLIHICMAVIIAAFAFWRFFSGDIALAAWFAAMASFFWSNYLDAEREYRSLKE